MVLSPMHPSMGEQVWGILRLVDTMGIATGCHAIPGQRKRLGKGRGQGPGSKDPPDGRILKNDRILMMMKIMIQIVFIS